MQHLRACAGRDVELRAAAEAGEATVRRDAVERLGLDDGHAYEVAIEVEARGDGYAVTFRAPLPGPGSAAHPGRHVTVEDFWHAEARRTRRAQRHRRADLALRQAQDEVQRAGGISLPSS